MFATIPLQNNPVLQILTKIALSFSLICLFITIIFFITYGLVSHTANTMHYITNYSSQSRRALFAHVHYFVHLNLSISLFCAYGIFNFVDFAVAKRVSFSMTGE